MDVASRPRPNTGRGRLADRVAVHTVPGDHVTLLSGRNVIALAEAMRECLAD